MAVIEVRKHGHPSDSRHVNEQVPAHINGESLNMSYFGFPTNWAGRSVSLHISATGKAVTVPSKVTEVESRTRQEDYEGTPSA